MEEGENTKFSIFNFKKRLNIVQQKMLEYSGFREIGAVAFIVGNSELYTYNKTSAMQEWLFGQDIPNTFIAISRSKFSIVSNESIVKALELADLGLGAVFEVYSESTFNIRDFESLLKRIDFDTNLSLGIFEKDKFDGLLAEQWYRYLAESTFKKADVSAPCGYVLAIKDDVEFKIIQDAATLCDDIYVHCAKSVILDAIDDERSITHAKIARDIEEALDETKLHPRGMSPEDLESPFPPIIQSGGEYNLKYSTTSDNRNLKYDCIVTMFGVRYHYYCTSIARTLMVRPSENLRNLYEFVLGLFELFIKTLKVGLRFCDVYNTVFASVKTTYPEFADQFFKSIGFVTGLEFRENSMIFDCKNVAVIQPGMVFIVLFGFQNLSISDYKTPVCVAIGDTVGLDSGGNVVFLTSCKRSLGSSTIVLSESSKKQDEDGRSIDNARGRKRQPVQDNYHSEEQRKAHQAELKIRLNEEARRRLIEKDQSNTTKSVSSKAFDGAYKSPSAIPVEPDVMNLKIYIDRKAETVILPVFGMAVPFHISTIKSVTSNVEGNHTYLRINFHTIVGSASRMEDLSITYGKNVYVKEMIFRSPNTRDNSVGAFRIVHIFNQIKELQKSYKARIQQESEMSGVIKQADLILNTTKNIPRLKDIQIKPQLGPRKSIGSLEAHANGFRYVSSRGEKLDILFENLKHAIFQPCDHETVITIHFHLRAHIMIGKRKFKDVQFFSEAGESVSDLGKMSSSMLDRDEIESEENEREHRNRLKAAYRAFIEKVEALTDNSIEFEVPIRELGFNGVPHKTSVFLIPTPNCLVNIIEQPPFVLSLNDIELVHFERVDFGMKNFDMVVIYKNYREKVTSICSIDMTDLEGIKDWLNSCDIKYTESKQNLNWAKIMKTILDDPEDFFAKGGWSFLDPDSDDANEEHADSIDEDEEYKPGSSDEFDAVSESVSDEDYVSENSESDFTVSEESESGKSWSELENEARMDDAIRFGSQYSPPEKRKLSPKGYVEKRRKM